MDGWQRAFVLHGRPYSETSLMLDLFTEGEGRMRVLAKGADFIFKRQRIANQL